VIISHRHKFVYVKTRKTASTSLEIALSKVCGPDDVITKIVAKDQALRERLGYPGPQNEHVHDRSGQAFELINHTPAAVARDLLGDRWGGYFTFTIERNPFDRVISQYWWEVQGMADPPPVSQFLERGRPELLSNWDLYTADDRLIVDHVGRYESLDESLAFIAARIGLAEAIVLPEQRVKSEFRRDRRPWREVLSDADRRLVEAVCRRELAAFGYAW